MPALDEGYSMLTRDLARWLPKCSVLAGSGMWPVACGPHWPRLPPPASPAPTSLACPHRPRLPLVFLSGPASILKTCAKGGPARPGSEAAKKKPADSAGKACRPGVAGKSVSHHHRHSAWQRTERWRVYRDTGMTEVDWATGSIYLRDPRADRAHLII